MKDYSATLSFLGALFADHPDGVVEFRAIPNEDKEQPARRLVTRDPDEATRFLARWDSADRSSYFGVGLRREGAPNGSRPNVIALPALWADIDIDKAGLDRADVLPKLQGLFHPPSLIVETGGGYHCYWRLREPVDVDQEGEQGLYHANFNENEAVALLKQLCAIVGGDPAVCDVARILRLPGTLNGKRATVEKYGEPRLCEVVFPADFATETDSLATYDFTDLEEWADWQPPVIVLPEQARVSRPSSGRAAGSAAEETNPFLAYVKNTLGVRFPIDVEAALAAMSLGANGDASVHQTQLRVSASLVSRGVPDAEIVELLLDHTKQVADAAGVGGLWNWTKERRALERMVQSAADKFGRPPPREEVLDHPLNESKGRAGQEDSAQTLLNDGDEGLTVEDDEPATGPEPAPPSNVVPMRPRGRGRPPGRGGGGGGSDPAHAPVMTVNGSMPINDAAIEAVIHVWEQEHGPMLAAEGDVWFWKAKGDEPTDLRWCRLDEGIKFEIEASAFEAVKALGKEASSGRAVTIFKGVTRRKSIIAREKDPFDSVPIIPCRDGALWLEDERVEPLVPDHRNTYVLAADAGGERGCPKWLTFLDTAFAHLDPASKRDTVQLLQEFFGLALARPPRGKVKRDFSKAMFLVGPARCGKSQITAVLSALMGGDDRVAGLSMEDLDDPFMREPLLYSVAWIADDAISQNTPMNAELFKKLVSGEVINMNRKHEKAVSSFRFGRPIMLTANTLPAVKDDSKAVYDRAFIIRFNRSWTREETRGQEEDVGQTIIREELSGVLWWAIEGRRRLFERGEFVEPATSRAAMDEFERDQNPVRAFMEDCLEIHAGTKIDRRDLYGLYKAWMIGAYGEDQKPVTAKTFLTWLRGVLDGQGRFNFDMKSDGRRYVVGLRVTKEGQQTYDTVNDGRDGRLGAALSGAYLNQHHLTALPAGTLNLAPAQADDFDDPGPPPPRDRTPRF